jgi:hypothetical protein
MFATRRKVAALKQECRVEHVRRFNEAVIVMHFDPAKASANKGFIDAIGQVLHMTSKDRRNTQAMLAPLRLDKAAYRAGHAEGERWCVKARQRHGLE